jgi:hypothetical protein
MELTAGFARDRKGQPVRGYGGTVSLMLYGPLRVTGAIKDAFAVIASPMHPSQFTERSSHNGNRWLGWSEASDGVLK